MNSLIKSSLNDPIKQRVLAAARLLFSERGLRGTDFREICQRAGVDVAAVSNHFRCKESLYEAVVSDASFQLATAAERMSKFSDDASSDIRLLRIITSLFKKLSEDRAWIARLVARQMADPAGERAGWVGLGLERYFLLLQAEINKTQGVPAADREVVRLHALSVISQCLFYCLAGENLPQVFLRLEGPLPAREMIARHVASLSLKALRYESRKQKTMNSSKDNKQGAAKSGGTVQEKCFICGDPVGDRWFCRIYREKRGPITLCRPNCAIRYLDSAEALPLAADLARDKSGL